MAGSKLCNKLLSGRLTSSNSSCKKQLYFHVNICKGTKQECQ